MGTYDFGIPKTSMPKINKNEFKIYQTKAGDRTRTTTQNKKLKEKAGFRCQRCKKKFHSAFLDVHHKKQVSAHKSKDGFDLPVMSMGKKIKPKYDSDKNAQVLCKKCHQEIHRQRTKRKTAKKKKQKLDLFGGYNLS